MLVNALKVKTLRQERTWTQQHLADACAVSLRTVQRVERYGNASHETLMSLAAVFDVSQECLVEQEEPVIIEEYNVTIDRRREHRLVAVALVLGMSIGASLMVAIDILS